MGIVFEKFEELGGVAALLRWLIQRSGLGELLLELIDTDPALEFARRFIVDVGEGIKKNAKRWAEAIREILMDRDRRATTPDPTKAASPAEGEAA